MAQAAPAPARRRSVLVLLPLLLFALVGIFLAVGLTRDPSTLPSALIGRPAPDFALPPLEGRDEHGLARADLGGQPMLVNVFASWCAPCRIEHPKLLQLKRRGIAVVGVAYKDEPVATRAFLDELGNPFAMVLVDREGRAGLDLGISGVPETFAVDAMGRITAKQSGPLLDDADIERLVASMQAPSRPPPTPRPR